ncbi:predicted protein [Botrytis cinerea T4]|uniref:Uncharacterized protein n=1 Tax=Botryotinia fuckeliana (strain T4) TaxID=999810 RepID=G2YZJ1_BOTF4|nr:predicted protein [Botrytis cinerea T4]
MLRQQSGALARPFQTSDMTAQWLKAVRIRSARSRAYFAS